jgi:hypothetical protein
MFTSDESPDRVSATPAAADHLRSLAQQRGPVTVLLRDDGAQVVPEGLGLPQGTLRLGSLADAVTVAADGRGRTAWWRNRAEIDLTGSLPSTQSTDAISFALQPLTEPELYAAVACGPLPRY